MVLATNRAFQSLGRTRLGLVLGSVFLAIAVLFVLWLAYHVLHHVVLVSLLSVPRVVFLFFGFIT